MKLSDLISDMCEISCSVPGSGRMNPLRPMTAENNFLKYRIRAAWKVLTGKADALEWDSGRIAIIGQRKDQVSLLVLDAPADAP
jgi:hypothetical protein